MADNDTIAKLNYQNYYLNNLIAQKKAQLGLSNSSYADSINLYQPNQIYGSNQFQIGDSIPNMQQSFLPNSSSNGFDPALMMQMLYLVETMNSNSKEHTLPSIKKTEHSSTGSSTHYHSSVTHTTHKETDTDNNKETTTHKDAPADNDESSSDSEIMQWGDTPLTLAAGTIAYNSMQKRLKGATSEAIKGRAKITENAELLKKNTIGFEANEAFGKYSYSKNGVRINGATQWLNNAESSNSRIVGIKGIKNGSLEDLQKFLGKEVDYETAIKNAEQDLEYSKSMQKSKTFAGKTLKTANKEFIDAALSEYNATLKEATAYKNAVKDLKNIVDQRLHPTSTQGKINRFTWDAKYDEKTKELAKKLLLKVNQPSEMKEILELEADSAKNKIASIKTAGEALNKIKAKGVPLTPEELTTLQGYFKGESLFEENVQKAEKALRNSTGHQSVNDAQKALEKAREDLETYKSNSEIIKARLNKAEQARQDQTNYRKTYTQTEKNFNKALDTRNALQTNVTKAEKALEKAKKSKDKTQIKTAKQNLKVANQEFEKANKKFMDAAKAQHSKTLNDAKDYKKSVTDLKNDLKDKNPQEIKDALSKTLEEAKKSGDVKMQKLAEDLLKKPADEIKEALKTALESSKSELSAIKTAGKSLSKSAILKGALGRTLGVAAAVGIEGWSLIDANEKDKKGNTGHKNLKKQAIKSGTAVTCSVIGTALGTFIPIPIVGSMIGGAIGYTIGSMIGDQISKNIDS